MYNKVNFRVGEKILMKKIVSKSFILNFFYGVLWFTPLYFFVRDFFNINDIGIIFERDTFNIMLFSIKQGLYSTLIALLVALIPAYLTAYERGTISKLLQGLLFIPFFFPVISTVTIFSIIFNLEFFRNLNILYTLKAIVIANVFYNSPIFIKYISEGLKRIPKEIVEAMKLDGAGKIKIFFSGQLPLIMPQLFRAFILVFTYCFVGFGIILSLGGIQFSTLEVEIATTLMSDLNFSKAMIYGLLQFVILIILNSIGGKITEYELEGEEEIQKQNLFMRGYSVIYLILQYFVVFSSVVFSFYNYYIGKFSFDAYKRIFSQEFNEEFEVIKGIVNSIGISTVVSFITVIFIYLIIKNYNRLIDIIIFANLGVSGAFLAISLFYMNVLFDIPLIALLIVGYVLSSIPVGYSFMYQYIKKFPRILLESSMLDCNNGFERFRYIEFPILKNLFLSAFLQIFAIVFGEFTIGYTMQLEDLFPVASLVNYSMVANKKYLESAAFSSVILIVVFMFFIIGEYFKDKE